MIIVPSLARVVDRLGEDDHLLPNRRVLLAAAAVADTMMRKMTMSRQEGHERDLLLVAVEAVVLHQDADPEAVWFPTQNTSHLPFLGVLTLSEAPCQTLDPSRMRP